MRVCLALLSLLGLLVFSLAAEAAQYRPRWGQVYTGVVGAPDPSPTEELTGRHAAVVQMFVAWGDQHQYVFKRARDARSRLSLHISTTAGPGSVERITPRQIALGAGDDYLFYLSREFEQWGGPVYLRLMAEMNAYWNPYAAYSQSGELRPGHEPYWYRQAWRRSRLIISGGSVAEINSSLATLGLPDTHPPTDRFFHPSRYGIDENGKVTKDHWSRDQDGDGLIDCGDEPDPDANGDGIEDDALGQFCINLDGDDLVDEEDNDCNGNGVIDRQEDVNCIYDWTGDGKRDDGKDLGPVKTLPQPRVAFLWVPQTAGSPDIPGNDPARFWPGQRWVDWVGTDFYSRFPNFSGLDRFYRRFARNKRKPFVLGEWAIWGSDDPAFVNRLLSWIAYRRRVAMIFYNQGINGDSPFRLWRYPNSAQALRIGYRAQRFVSVTPEWR